MNDSLRKRIKEVIVEQLGYNTRGGASIGGAKKRGTTKKRSMSAKRSVSRSRSRSMPRGSSRKRSVSRKRSTSRKRSISRPRGASRSVSRSRSRSRSRSGSRSGSIKRTASRKRVGIQYPTKKRAGVLVGQGFMGDMYDDDYDYDGGVLVGGKASSKKDKCLEQTKQCLSRKKPVPSGTSKWINFVKKFAKSHDISYKDALKKASREYSSKMKK